MRKEPIIQDFKVPDGVFVNLQNNGNFQRVPLSNLDNHELEGLCRTFVEGVAKRAGRQVIDSKIIIDDYSLEPRGLLLK